jgi:hypothetical protein
MATRASSEEPPLQELEVPLPWRVASCTLRALDPAEMPPEDPRWGWFTEDLAQLVHPSGLLLDIGWRPDGAPDGRFRLVAIQDRDWAHPIHEAELRSLPELLGALREQLAVDRGPPLTDEGLLARLRTAEDPREAASLVVELRERGQVPVLIGLLADPRPLVRSTAVDALGALGASSAGEALFARFLLPEPDLATRKRLLDALAAVGHRPAVPVLQRWLGNPDPEQRIAAARALVRLGATESIDAVQEAYATERSHRVRPHLQEALQKLVHARRGR